MYFNPRAPRGARREVQDISAWQGKFQSTRPAWGATFKGAPVACEVVISIHAPRVGRDRLFLVTAAGRIYFNPRAPRGARPGDKKPVHGEEIFQSTRPAWGATQNPHVEFCDIRISIHAPRVGRDKGFVPFK